MHRKQDWKSCDDKDEPSSEQDTNQLSIDGVLSVPREIPPSDDELSFPYLFVASSGQSVALHACGSTWQARVSDERFPGFSFSYTTDVCIEPDYGVNQLANEPPSRQANRIQLLPNGKGKTIVYVGSTGLKGGGNTASNEPVWRCVCGFSCPNRRSEQNCSHKGEHQNCLLRYQQAQLERRCQEELRKSKTIQSQLQQNLNAQAQWRADCAVQRRKLAALERQRESARQKRIVAEQAARAAQRAERKELSLTTKFKKSFTDTFSYMANKLLEQNVWSDNEEETADKSVAVAVECEASEVSEYYVVKKAADIDSNLLPDVPTAEHWTDRVSASLPPSASDRTGLQLDRNKTEDLLFDDAYDTLDEHSAVAPAPQNHNPESLTVADSTASSPTLAQTLLFGPLSRVFSFGNVDEELPFVEDISEEPAISFSDDGRDDLCSKRESAEGEYVSCKDLSSAPTSSEDSLVGFKVVRKTASMADLPLETHVLAPLRKAESLDGVDKLLPSMVATLTSPAASPVNHFITDYCCDLALEEQVAFLKRGGKFLESKLAAESVAIQQAVVDHFYQVGGIYPAIMEQHPASDWLQQCLLREVVQDPIADPIGLEIFLQRWENITYTFDASEQIQLLQAIWKAKKTLNLSLAKVSGILELIITTGLTGSEIVFDELLDALVHSKKYWLKAQFADLPQLAVSESESDQLADALATSHLNMGIIKDVIVAIKETEETLDVADLVEFFTLVKEKAVAEVVLSTTLQETEIAPIDAMSKPQQWIHFLTCHLLYSRIAQADLTVSNDIVAALNKKIQQNRSVVAPVQEFFANHLDLAVANSAAFIDVVELLYTYQVGKTISAAVLECLPSTPAKKWVEMTDQVIVSQIFEESHSYTADELMQLIAERAPVALNDPLAASATNYHLADNMLESAYKERVAEALKTRIVSELEAVKSSDRGALEALKQQVNRLNEKLMSVEEEKKVLGKNLDEFKAAHVQGLEDIQEKETQVEHALDCIKNGWEEHLEDEKQNEIFLRLGHLAAVTSVSTFQKSKEITLKELSRDLNKERDNLHTKLTDFEFAHDEKIEQLAMKEESHRDSLTDLETDIEATQEKIDRLSQEDAACFSNHDCYKRVLESFVDSVNRCESAASVVLKESTLLFKSKPICQWDKQEVTAWSAFVRQIVQSSDGFSRGVVELIAGIKRAMSLTLASTLSSEQLLQLLALLFPVFKQESPVPVKDSLVVVALAAISALHLGQVSLATDSELLPLPKSEFKQYATLFETLNVTAAKKSSWDGKQAVANKSLIVYGSFFDFKNQGQNLIAYNQLEEKLYAVNKCYKSRSDILQAAKVMGTLPKDSVISSWDAQAVTQWATYAQNYMPSYHVDFPPTVSLEYMAVIKRAVVLAYGKPPTASQLWALFAKLDGNQDRNQLTKQDQKDPVVIVMATALEALQKKQSAICSHFSAAFLNEHEYFFSLLKLTVDQAVPQEPREVSISATHFPIINEEPCADTPTQPLATNLSETECIAKKSNENYVLLQQAYTAVDVAYRGPSTLLSDNEDNIQLTTTLLLDNEDNIQLTTKPISKWKKAHVTTWATKIATLHEPNLLIKAELIAGIKRAVELVHGVTPRDAQILTLLTLLAESSKGCLAQVNTGEGKSLIVAMLAAIHALQGKQVDVVTTSTELTKPEVNKQKPFFELLNLTVGENSADSSKADTYKCHIVYGTATDFQADILRQEFLGQDIRGYRRHDIVLVDEVDSLLYDNRAHSVRLTAGNDPGMQHVTLPLAAVWHRVQKIARHMEEYDGQTFFIEDDFVRTGTKILLASGTLWNDCTEKVPVQDKRLFITQKTTEYLEELLRKLNDKERLEYEEYLTKEYEKTALEGKIEAAAEESKKSLLDQHNLLDQEIQNLSWVNRHPIISVPNHLQDFARNQIPHWIKHCLDALYAFKKDAHYTVVNDRIVPIQYNETGVLEANMVWSDGLTQFLQIKEGLAVAAESITANFMSNVGFFKRYGSAIYGLTGTLGEEATQSFLRDLYDINFVIIPPHKRRMIRDNGDSLYFCKELAPMVASANGWHPTLVEDVLYRAKIQQAVLVICKNDKQVHDLAQKLSVDYDSEKIFKCTKDVTFDRGAVDSGEIIVASSAVCGELSLNTSDSVEESGGLYVAETSLSWYLIVMKQALHHARQRRAVLLICRFIKQVHDLAELLAAEYDKKKIFKYTGEDASFAKKKIDSGEIIIATNIAGRGTDLEPSKAVEDYGGLYVAVTFLPETCRVELQNVGRTARAGNKGMAQLIVCSEVGTTVESLKAIRHEKEEVTIKMATKEARKMLIQDTLFQNFCQLEAKHLPSAQDCENARLAATLSPQWEAFREEHNCSDDVLDRKFKKCKRENIAKLQAETASMKNKVALTVSEQERLWAEFEQKLEQQKEAFLIRHKTKLLKDFSVNRPTIPPPVWQSLLKGTPLTSPMSDSAKTNEWGIFERQAIEERWALWLKSKNLEKRSSTEVLPLLEEFKDEFAASVDEAVKCNQLIENPFFYILKGNEYLGIYSNAYFKSFCEEQLEKAIDCYDQAIQLDKTFSVHARYNKACALLYFAKNAGERQERADRELKQAEIIISTIYRPYLTTFDTFIAGGKGETGTRQHIQHQVSVVSHLERHIQEARKVIAGAVEKGHNVKLSHQLIEKTLRFRVEQDFDKAIKEANINGLTHLFTISEKAPTPWSTVTGLALLALSQIAAGVLITAMSGVGWGLVYEGVNDLIASMRVAMGRNFTWATWAAQKSVSLAISLATAGWSRVKNGCVAFREGATKLFSSAGRNAIKQSVKEATNVVLSALGKGVLAETVSQASQLAFEPFEKALKEYFENQAEETLIKTFATNNLVVLALEQDRKNGNNRWLQQFLRDGTELLANKASFNPCLSMLKDIGVRLAREKVHFVNGNGLQAIHGMSDVFIKLATHTKAFVKEFNDQVEKYREDIVSNQQRGETSTSSDNVTIQSSAPDVDLDEEFISVDKVAASTDYSSKAVEAKPLPVNNVGKSTVDNLAYQFRDQISEALVASVKQGVQTVAEAGARELSSRLFKNLDETNARFLAETQEKWRSEHNMSQATAKEEGAQSSEPAETAAKKKKKPEKKKSQRLADEDTAPKLTAETESFKESFQKDGPKDKMSLVLLSTVTGYKIEIYNVEGHRTSVVRNQNESKGASLKLVFEPGKDGARGHFRPVDQPQARNLSLMDAVLMQLRREELAELGGRRGVIEKGVEHIDTHPEVFNQLCEQRTRVQSIDAGSLMLEEMTSTSYFYSFMRLGK